MNKKELKEWILKNLYSKDGYLRPQKLSKFIDIKTSIIQNTNFLNNNVSITQRCWHIVNEVFENVLCPVCGYGVNFRDYSYGYNTYCSKKCSNRCVDKQNKISNTKLKRYGDKNYNNREKFKTTCEDLYPNRPYNNPEKTKQTNLERYGDEVYTNLEQNKQTNLERYGASTPFGNREVWKKGRETKLERYGDENYNNRDQYKETCFEKYGVGCALESNYIREKIKQTNLERYGVEYPLQSNYIREKIKQTNLERYGVYNYVQYPLFLEKNQSGYKYSWHSYTLPSGMIIKLQGYEPNAMDMLLLKYKENDILYKKSEVPEIWYLKSETNTWHRYFCDFYIPKDNLIVEVKSKYTYDVDKQVNLDKQKACLYLGYDFKFMIL